MPPAGRIRSNPGRLLRKSVREAATCGLSCGRVPVSPRRMALARPARTRLGGRVVYLAIDVLVKRVERGADVRHRGHDCQRNEAGEKCVLDEVLALLVA